MPQKRLGFRGKKKAGEVRPLGQATGKAALVTGLILSWGLAVLPAVFSIVLTIPPDFPAFLPQFIIFLVAATVGLLLTSWGAQVLKGLGFTGEVSAYSGILMLAAAVTALAIRWGAGFQFGDLAFWFRMAYAFGVIGMGTYSLAAWKRIGI